MGYPSTSLEGLYLNPKDEVQKFLIQDIHHINIIYARIKYLENSFFKKGYFPFKDHEAPPLNLIRTFYEDAKKFLEENEKKAIDVHCKAGKNRTRTLIGSLLLYMKVLDTADECLQYCGMMRIENGKGVTIPSHIRFIEYFEKILKNNMEDPITFIKKCINKFRTFTIPMFNKKYTPGFIIENIGNKYKSVKKKVIIEGEDLDAFINFDIVKGFIVEGIVYVSFFRIHIIGQKEKIFKFWYNINSYLIIVIFMNSKKEKLIKIVKIKIVNIIALDLE